MRSRFLLAVLPVLLALSAPAFARGGTLDSILPGIRAQHPGRLSDAEPFTAPDGSTHYRIKWMTREGRILYFDADARSGRYSSSGGDGGWRRGDDEPRGTSRWRGEPDAREDDGGRRRDWNGTGGSDWNRGGDWGSDRAGANWPGRGGDGAWRGGRGEGDWGGRGGNWRGGRNGGDNGGSHHHHGG